MFALEFPICARSAYSAYFAGSETAVKTTNYFKAKPLKSRMLGLLCMHIWELNKTYFSTVASELREHDVAVEVSLFSGHFGRPNILNTTRHGYYGSSEENAFNDKL